MSDAGTGADDDTATGRGLSDVSEPDLLSLSLALERGELSAPFTPAALQSRSLGHLSESLRPYLGLDSAGLGAVVSAVLAERRLRKQPKLTLVWTGEDPGIGHSRYTRIVLPELFAGARQHVLVAGYSFDRGGELFAALHAAMKTHGTTADFFVDVQQLIQRLRNAAKAARKDC